MNVGLLLNLSLSLSLSCSLPPTPLSGSKLSDEDSDPLMSPEIDLQNKPTTSSNQATNGKEHSHYYSNVVLIKLYVYLYLQSVRV